jgi:hypothetical protein
MIDGPGPVHVRTDHFSVRCRVVSAGYTFQVQKDAVWVILCENSHFPVSTQIAITLLMEKGSLKRVLIYDEARFSRICSALLEMYGFNTDIMAESSSKLDDPSVGVFVTSYPYGALLLGEVHKRKIPTVVLFDNIDDQFINFQGSDQKLYCMIKPVDYERFKGLVQQLLKGNSVPREDYTVL